MFRERVIKIFKTLRYLDFRREALKFYGKEYCYSRSIAMRILRERPNSPRRYQGLFKNKYIRVVDKTQTMVAKIIKDLL